MLTLLIWSYASVVLENVHPYQGGYFRRKYRTDRRPTLPVESALAFYPRYIASQVTKHVKVARIVWRYRRLALQLKRDPTARLYSDIALTPEADDDFDSLELFTSSAAAKSAVTHMRTPDSHPVGAGAKFKIVQ